MQGTFSEQLIYHPPQSDFEKKLCPVQEIEFVRIQWVDIRSFEITSAVISYFIGSAAQWKNRDHLRDVQDLKESQLLQPLPQFIISDRPEAVIEKMLLLQACVNKRSLMRKAIISPVRFSGSEPVRTELCPIRAWAVVRQLRVSSLLFRWHLPRPACHRHW